MQKQCGPSWIEAAGIPEDPYRGWDEVLFWFPGRIARFERIVRQIRDQIGCDIEGYRYINGRWFPIDRGGGDGSEASLNSDHETLGNSYHEGSESEEVDSNTSEYARALLFGQAQREVTQMTMHMNESFHLEHARHTHMAHLASRNDRNAPFSHTSDEDMPSLLDSDDEGPEPSPPMNASEYRGTLPYVYYPPEILQHGRAFSSDEDGDGPSEACTAFRQLIRFIPPWCCPAYRSNAVPSEADRDTVQPVCDVCGR